ncbi:MAG: hypothetical protein ACXAAT_08200, partial [Candidatus Hodarchaeales archaeon]
MRNIYKECASNTFKEKRFGKMQNEMKIQKGHKCKYLFVVLILFGFLVSYRALGSSHTTNKVNGEIIGKP